MNNLFTKIIKIPIHSFLLIINNSPHFLHIIFLITKQKNQFSRIQIILIQPIS